jgi:hypothetical protein
MANSYETGLLTLPIANSNVCLDGLEYFPLHLEFKALEPRIVGEP